jgi:hypothetical protein
MTSILEKKYIPNEDFVFRDIHFTVFKKWSENKRKPNEADFIPDPDGLSVNWETYCTPEERFVIIGTSKKANGDYKNHKEFKAIRFNVGLIRSITTIEGDNIDVIHDPQEDNYSHSLIYYSEDDEEIRVKLCDIVHENYDSMVLKPSDFPSIEKQIEKLKIEKS